MANPASSSGSVTAAAKVSREPIPAFSIKAAVCHQVSPSRTATRRMTPAEVVSSRSTCSGVQSVRRTNSPARTAPVLLVEAARAVKRRLSVITPLFRRVADTAEKGWPGSTRMTASRPGDSGGTVMNRWSCHSLRPW